MVRRSFWRRFLNSSSIYKQELSIHFQVIVLKHKLPELPYSYDALEPHISELTLQYHHDTHHQGYVNGVNSAEEGLEKQRKEGDFSSTGELMDSFSHNFCGNILHTHFWNNMSPDGGGKPDGLLMERIEEDFGSYQNWKKEFKACGKAADGWALLAYIPRTGELHNIAVDRHNKGAVWGAHPILVMDVWEHAYYNDYGPERGEFIDNFFRILDWNAVSDRLESLLDGFE